MQDTKLIYPRNFTHGHFYRHLDGVVFCYLKINEKRILEYIDGRTFGPINFKRPGRSVEILLSQGVLEIDPKEHVKELKDRIARVESILEKAEDLFPFQDNMIDVPK